MDMPPTPAAVRCSRPRSLRAQLNEQEESLRDVPRPVVPDRWTTEAGRAYLHPAMRVEGLQSVNEALDPSSVAPAPDGEAGPPAQQQQQQGVTGSAAAPTAPANRAADCAVVTRSSTAQTRPPFCAYGVESFNQLVPRPVREAKSDFGKSEARGASGRRSGGPPRAQSASRVGGTGRSSRGSCAPTAATTAAVPEQRTSSATRTPSPALREVRGRTSTRRTFADSGTQTAQDQVALSTTSAGLARRALFTTNLFLCPSCQAVLRSNQVSPVCQRCGACRALPLFTCQQVNAPGHFRVDGVVLAQAPRRAPSPPVNRHSDSISISAPPPPSPQKQQQGQGQQRRSSSVPLEQRGRRGASAQECLHWFD